MLIHLFHPPTPPIVNQDDCAVVHIFMDGEPRYHEKGRVRPKYASLAEFMVAQRKLGNARMRKYRKAVK